MKDINELINQIEQLKLPTDCKLASIDISLYTNIPHEEGTQKMYYNF